MDKYFIGYLDNYIPIYVKVLVGLYEEGNMKQIFIYNEKGEQIQKEHRMRVFPVSKSQLFINNKLKNIKYQPGFKDALDIVSYEKSRKSLTASIKSQIKDIWSKMKDIFK